MGQRILGKPFIYFPVGEQCYNPVNILVIGLCIKSYF